MEVQSPARNSATADIDRLCGRLGYLSAQEIQDIRKAYQYAKWVHKNQFRKSGEQYITHPLKVATILSDLEPDSETIISALLHDVIEDSHVCQESLQQKFGNHVAAIVEGVSKLADMPSDNYQLVQAENFQKMALAMAEDVRVIIVKLADRLHNMRTIQHLSVEKQKRIASETLYVYAPIANRLGMDDYFRELQDMSFKVLYPMRYFLIDKAVNKARKKNKDYVEEITRVFAQMLEHSGLRGTVEGRRKHLAGIYLKMSGGRRNIHQPYAGLYPESTKKVSFANIMDIHGFRIITDSVDNCYLLLGHVHRVFKPYPNRFKDYIAVPKKNGYQSLHTTVMGIHGYPIEVQIRTDLMHRVAQTGIASHWIYQAQKKSHQSSSTADQDSWYANWRRDLLSIQAGSSDSKDFFRNVRLNLFSNEVYVFSPDGDIYSLPKGATPVDFAYAVHTDIGNTCIGCKINGEKKPLSTKLENGWTVSITTDVAAKPNPRWREFVVTARALTAMGYVFKQLRQNESVQLGKELLNNALSRYKMNIDLLTPTSLESFLAVGGYQSLDDVLHRLGSGKVYPATIANQLMKEVEQLDDKNIKPFVVSKKNASILVFGRCCQPIRQDAIFALVRSDQGISIHRAGCKNVRKLRKDPKNYLVATWSHDLHIELPVKLRVEVTNNLNLVGPITSSITALGCTVLSMDNTDRDVHIQVLLFTVLVRGRNHLSNLLRKLRLLADIKRVSRV